MHNCTSKVDHPVSTGHFYVEERNANTVNYVPIVFGKLVIGSSWYDSCRMNQQTMDKIICSEPC